VVGQCGHATTHDSGPVPRCRSLHAHLSERSTKQRNRSVTQHARPPDHLNYALIYLVR